MHGPSKSADKLWFAVLAASLLLNAYFYFNKKDRSAQVLASVEGRTFRWKDVSEPSQKSFRQMDKAYYFLLKSEAERWAANHVLAKEARAKGVDVDKLLQEEVFSKVSVPAEDVQRRYALSPASDGFAWPDVLKEIENDLFNNRAHAARKAYVGALFAKHRVRFNLQRPASVAPDETEQAFTRFPVYEPPSGEDLLSRGPQDAPLVIEVYSDYHCPFSKRFAATLKEVEAAYPGQAREIFHHFPLPIHPEAPAAHEAAACAGDQGKFWEFHDRLMAAREKPGRDTFSAWAGELGLDKAAFDSCVETDKHKTGLRQELAQARTRGVGSTPVVFINGRMLNGAVPMEALKPILDWHLDPSGQYPGPTQRQRAGGGAPQRPSSPRIDPSKVYSFDAAWLKKGPSSGPGNAPVTLVELFDYHCPFCQKGAAITEQLLKEYPGKLRVAHRQLPLPMHPNAAKAAEAVLCAEEQGRFQAYRGELFGGSWGKQSVDDMKAAAKAAKLDSGRFDACLDSSKMRPAVEEDMRVINAHGMTGTPAFFVNGSPVIGAQPVENFKKLIDEKLAQ